MRYWTGFMLFAIAGGLLMNALAHRRRVLEARHAAALRGEPIDTHLHPSLAVLSDILPPVVITLMAVLAVKLALVFYVLRAGRVFSIFDLAGLVGLLAAYGTWLIIKTRYRLELRPAVAAGAAAIPAINLQRQEPGDERQLSRPDRAPAGLGDSPGPGDLAADLPAARRAA